MLASYRWLCVAAALLALPISQAAATPQDDSILTEIATFGHGAIRLSEWSENGEMLAVYINDELRIYHNGTPDPLVIPYFEEIKVMKFRQDNQMLAVAEITAVKFWDTSTGEMLAQADIPGAGSLQFISNQSYINLYQVWDRGGGSPFWSVVLWDYHNETEVQRFEFESYPSPSAVLQSGDFIVATNRSSQNGSGSNIAYLSVLDSATGEHIFNKIDVRPSYSKLIPNPIDPAHICRR